VARLDDAFQKGDTEHPAEMGGPVEGEAAAPVDVRFAAAAHPDEIGWPWPNQASSHPLQWEHVLDQEALLVSGSKIVAGGLAAATSAVLGSYFGIFGTVGGAAAGSVVTALSSEIYQRSIERTTNRLRSRSNQGSREPLYEQRQPRETTVRRGSALPRVLLVTVVMFALGIGVVSGLERVTGAPLSGGAHGTTSLGQVLPLHKVPVVGDLLGGSGQHDDTTEDQPSQRRSPGLVNGLLSGL
jgi:hypothetical protein